MSSMKVTSRPQGCGRCTIRRSSSTRVICSRKKSSLASEKQCEHGHGEKMGVPIGIAQLIRDSLE